MKKISLFLAILIFSVFLVTDIKAEDGLVSASAPAPVAGYEGGFFIQSPSTDYKFTLNGRFQPKIYYEKTRDNPSNFSFAVRRARVDFGFTIAKNGFASFSLQHSTDSANFQTMNITGAVAGWSVAPEFTITAGMVGMPLSIIGARGSLGFLLLETPITQTQKDTSASTLTPIRSSFGNPSGLGIEFTGTIKKFFYDLSVVNGAAATTLQTATTTGAGGEESDYDLNFNKRVSAGARLAYNIFDPAGSLEMDFPYSEKAKWTISVGGNYQGKRQDPYSAAVVKYILTGSIGTSFKWRGFAINAEAYGRKTKLDSPGTATYYETIMDDFGYYVDGGYYFIPNKLEIALSGSQIIREGPTNNSYQLGGGLNWYIVDNNIKLQLVYTLTSYYFDYRTTTNTPNVRISKDHNLGLMMTACF